MFSRVGNKVLGGVLVLALTGALPGCSFLFTTAPKSAESPTEFASSKCTTSKAAPIVDTLIAGYQGFRTAYAISADDSAYKDLPISREADIAFGVGFLALYGASAVYGYYVTGKCSARHDRAVIVEHKEPERETWDPDTRPPPPAAPRQQWDNRPRPVAPKPEPAP